MLEAIILIGVIPVTIAGVILRGWALSVLWGWFVVNAFHLPALGVAEAIGVSMIVGMLTKESCQKEKSDDEPKTKLIKILGETFLSPLLAIGLGWVVRQFV